MSELSMERLDELATARIDRDGHLAGLCAEEERDLIAMAKGKLAAEHNASVMSGKALEHLRDLVAAERERDALQAKALEIHARTLGCPREELSAIYGVISTNLHANADDEFERDATWRAALIETLMDVGSQQARAVLQDYLPNEPLPNVRNRIERFLSVND